MARGTGDEMGLPAPRAAESARPAHLPVPVDAGASRRQMGLRADRPQRPPTPGLPRADRPPARGGQARRPRRVSRLAALVAVLGAAVAGCGNEAITGGGEVPSSTLTVYSLLPDPQSAAGGDLVNGEKLALAQAGGRAGRFAVTFASLAEGTGGRRADVASATRSVIGDPQAIAVIGGLDTAGTRTSAPLFNEAGYLQVALGAGYPG